MGRVPSTLGIVLAAALAGACRDATGELARGRASPDGPAVLVEALADRFGPVDREPAFDALRPKLARAALVPSRVFDDPTAWTTRADGWRAIELAGYGSGGTYRIGVRGEAPSPEAPGQYRELVRLERVGGRRFEWRIDEELAVGRVRPSDLAAALDAAFRAAETSTEASARAGIAEVFPRASAKVGLLLRLEALSPQRDAHGATSVHLAVRLVPDGIRGFAPRYAAFLEKYARAIRASLRVADPEGATFWTLEAADNLWTVRLRIRDGNLVPLEGPADRRLPPRLRATGDYSTQMGRFKVGAARLAADVTLVRTPGEKALVARFLAEPDWRLPFLVETLLGGPLSYPFEGPGSEVAWGAREAPDGGTHLVGRYRARVRETWILRWLGGLTSGAVSEFRRGAEAEADRFHRACLLALRDDLVALETPP